MKAKVALLAPVTERFKKLCDGARMLGMMQTRKWIKDAIEV